jgi:tetraacyldisaccharide 4'-kinase
MTAKDAVKCRKFAQPDWYYLAIHAQLPDAFWQQFDLALQQFQAH